MAWMDDIERQHLYQRANIVICADGYASIVGAKGGWREKLADVTNADDEPNLGSIDWFGDRD